MHLKKGYVYYTVLVISTLFCNINSTLKIQALYRLVMVLICLVPPVSINSSGMFKEFNNHIIAYLLAHLVGTLTIRIVCWVSSAFEGGGKDI